MSNELAHYSDRYPDLGNCRKARIKMGKVAASMVGCHYLKGAKGARPNQGGGAPPRPGNVTLLMDTDPENPAFLAAGSPLDVTYVCAGNCVTLNQPRFSASDVQTFLKQQDPKNPGRCFTRAGFTPRRVIESADDKGNPNLGTIVWGQCCDGWRHFDCLGLIDYALAQVSMSKDEALRAVWQWASVKNTIKAVKIAPKDVFDGDLVAKKVGSDPFHHIGMIYVVGNTPFIAQAERTGIGVTIGTPYKTSEWNQPCWRIPNEMLRLDAAVNDDMPSMGCEPSVHARAMAL